MTDTPQPLPENISAQLQVLMAEQQASAKMLIRRDLELSRANERLQALDRAKTEFISVAAHQLRTPLTAIKWILTMVLKNEFTDEQERLQFIEKAAESTDRMIALVNDLLEVDHMQSGKGQFAFQPIAVKNLLEAVVLELSPMIMARHLTFNPAIDAQAIVRGDAEKLRSVFQNLIENAIKYTMPGGAIMVTAKPDGQNILITIQDTGIGVSLEEQAQLFTKFFRAKNALKIDTTGSGLGLFIVKQVVERHGGKVWCESVLGKGATFFIVLPRAHTS